METVPYKINEAKVEARKSMETFGKIKLYETRKFIQVIETPIKFKRCDEEVLEDDESDSKQKGVYRYTPTLEVNSKKIESGGNVYIPPNFFYEKATVKITNIPTEITRNQLEAIIVKATESYPTSIVIALDRDTRESRGFGYVEFNSIQEAKLCVEKIEKYKIDEFLLGAELIKN